jgi:protein TonB
LRLDPSRAGALATAALHAAALATLLAHEPARSAITAAAPIMVDWIAAPKSEPAPEPSQLPQLKPVHRKPRSVETPRVVTAPVETPSPLAAPAPSPSPPEAVAVAAEPTPAAVAPPIFSADYLQNPAPVYPTLSRKLGEQGRVLLRVRVNPNGGADEVRLQTSSGFARLDESARATVASWRFAPARQGNEPVPAWVLIPVSFQLDS